LFKVLVLVFCSILRSSSVSCWSCVQL